MRNRIIELENLKWSPAEIRKELNLNNKDYLYHKRQIRIKHPDMARNRCSGKPFWIWSRDHYKHPVGDCCFQHIVGLPEKNGKKMPLFDYEGKIFDALNKTDDFRKNKHIWIKKATGLGITEFFLRYIAWLCYHDGTCRNAQMCIVTGPNIYLASGLIRRLDHICRLVEDDERRVTETSIILNGCRVEAFPSHHLDAMRSLPSPKFIFIDEADFFPTKELANARDVAERYIAKSDPYIVMVSTPNVPDGLYESIEKEPEEKCIYRRIFLPYTVGLNKIYTKEDIRRAKESPSFEREYNLQYGHGIGDIFPSKFVDDCVLKYDLALGDGQKVLAVDPGYGSSKYAILGAELAEDGIVYVKAASQYDRPFPGDMLNIITEMAKRYRTVVVDGSHPEIVRELERRGVDASSISFGEKLQEMTLLASQLVMERQVRIHEGFEDLVHQLKSARTNKKGNPDKNKMRSFDLGDALLIATYHLKRDDNRLYAAKI